MSSRVAVTLPRRTRVAVAAACAALWPPSAAADCPSALKTRPVPLPVYATLPNEGSTWGVMPVFIRICPDHERTAAIIAPSLTWNSVIHFTGTYRWFDYPSDDTTMTVIASASTRINYNGLFRWQRLPTEPGRVTQELTLRLQRSAFYRFFGFGPDTPTAAETSYTRFQALVATRFGVNVARHLNLGATLNFERDGVESRGVPGLPLSPEVFPDAPGMRGATLLSQGLDLRYDSRLRGDYADRGLRVSLSATVVEGLASSPTFLRAGLQVSGIVPEGRRVSSAARFAWTGVSSSRAPFFAQSSLGGSSLLRGFTEDRFTDVQAWTMEVEQRFTVLQTHIYGVTADWRIDPFVATGQTFASVRRAFSHPRLAAGLGFRAFVHPNVAGRIDVAVADEGIKVYVEIGYPY